MSLYLAPIQSDYLTPKIYDEKIRFWKGMIENYCEYKRSSKICIQELKFVFKRFGVVPSCLSTVIAQMQSEGSAVEEEKFMQQPKSNFGVAMETLIVKPFSKGVEMIRGKMATKIIDEQIMFIVLSAIINQSRQLLEHIEQHLLFNQIISMDELAKDEIKGLSNEGIPPVLHYIASVSKRVSITNKSESNQLLKFFEPHSPATPITEMERSIFNLQQTEKLLLGKINRLGDMIKEVKEKARRCLKEENKEMAKSWLRKKLLMEEDLTKRINVLDTVQTMLHRVRSSKSDCDILSTYQTGLDSIKSIYNEPNMSFEHVQKVIDEMREVFEQQNEFEALLTETESDNDQSENLEQELQDLIEKKSVKEDKLPKNWHDDFAKRREVFSSLPEKQKAKKTTHREVCDL